ncbi:glutamate synthase [Tetzosporium hominis]|uniref:Glutamate synthase n=1 Tax=Tetzosporium hominis TaxID=2020506 RepID=A0A264W522_9BACL|nr:glutamate synthase subunit beta [Tetzosporium hominis]OZS78683.1 glutamate synthase [Tetzosporium hominis]
MGKPTGFLEIDRKKPLEEPAKKRIRHFHEYGQRFTDSEMQEQGARCMDCGTPFCHMGIEIRGVAAGCPIQNVIPEWNDLVYRGQWKDALDRLLMTNNFPEFTGRVCPAPCESSCVLGISEPAVAIKGIERSIIDKGFEEGWITPRIPVNRTGKKIAIVGSGPAGLTAADDLNQEGHSVTVFERDDRPGGLLMYGIPSMKLDKDVVLRRVHLLAEEGIQFIVNTEIGKDITLTQLREEFDAVILCVGAQKQRVLHLPGDDAQGIVPAMQYLSETTKAHLDGTKPRLDVSKKHVLVIGGGDTGADCVATAIRQGCKSIVQFGKHPKLGSERDGDHMWPSDPNVFKMDYAYEEALATKGQDPREYLIQTKEIVKGHSGEVVALKTIQMEKVVGEDGFHYFRELPGTEKEWPADVVFVAIGFEGIEEQVAADSDLSLSRNRIAASKVDYATNIPSVFTAGDARRGQSLVVWAIKEGKEAAQKVNQFVATPQPV